MAKTPSTQSSTKSTAPVTQPPIKVGDSEIGHFHKTLEHDNKGHVANVTDWTGFLGECVKDPYDPLKPGTPDFSGIAHGPLKNGDFYSGSAPGKPAPFVDPLGGWTSGDGLGPDPTHFMMPEPPAFNSLTIAAEMNELYWMAALRDVPFNELASQTSKGAVADINDAYSAALKSEVGISKYADIPVKGGKANFSAKTLFSAGLKGEGDGPFVSQFFLHDINYGAQLIMPTQIPYREGRDYLTSTEDWLLAQNTGYDRFGDWYGVDNDFGKDPTYYEDPLPDGRLPRYYIRNMRDLGRFVNRDALHQAYFNAALLLNNWKVPSAVGFPYKSGDRETGFATLGGPEILALVGTVATYALRAVWRQKWHVYLRFRPEGYGGLAELDPASLGASFNALQGFAGAKQSRDLNGNYLLPIAFSAGSPPHPSYGAGHATVAGACVTLLKAWFDGGRKIVDVFASVPSTDPGQKLVIRQPGTHQAFGSLPIYASNDRHEMTVEGELNKLAANVALGRSMGGVHFRTDNTRSLRLGEAVTAIFLMNWVQHYQESKAPKTVSFDFNSFDGAAVKIDTSGVTVGGTTYATAKDVQDQYNAVGHI